MAAHEILMRGQYVRGYKMLAFLVVYVVMAISSAYELIEWLAAVMFGEGAYDFLGTQGDPWDTQADMLFAIIGVVAAMILLRGFMIASLRCFV